MFCAIKHKGQIILLNSYLFENVFYCFHDNFLNKQIHTSICILPTLLWALTIHRSTNDAPSNKKFMTYKSTNNTFFNFKDHKTFYENRGPLSAAKLSQVYSKRNLYCFQLSTNFLEFQNFLKKIPNIIIVVNIIILETISGGIPSTVHVTSVGIRLITLYLDKDKDNSAKCYLDNR